MEPKEETPTKKPQKKPGLISKIKESIDEKEEQLDLLATFVRLGILVWSGAILTLAYVDIPKLPKQDLDPTFIASVFTGVLATFGVQAAKDKHHGPSGGITKAQMQELIDKAAQVAPSQTIKIEHTTRSRPAIVTGKLTQ